MEITKFYRQRWRWQQLQAIRTYLLDILAARDSVMGHRRGRRKRTLEEAERYWEANGDKA